MHVMHGFYCDGFTPNKPYKPTLWTEAWSGWFSEFGGTVHHRPVQDLAFAVARFIQKGGSYVNYYMVYPTMRSAFVDIVKTRGFRGLYVGLSPTLVEIVPYAGLQFGTYDTFKRWTMMLNQFRSSSADLYVQYR